MTKLPRFLFALWIVIAGCAGSPQPCVAENGDMPVTLRSAVELRSMIVHLSDIFDGVSASSDRAIAQAPAPGKQVTYDVNVLTRVVEKYKLDWKPQSIADHITITTACAHITNEMIRDAVAAKVKETNSDNGVRTKGSVDVVFDNHALEISLPADHAPDFTLNNFAYDPLSKRFRADLVAETPGGLYSFPVMGRVSLKRTVPVLARRLEAGAIIDASDLDQMDVPEERVNDAVVSDASQLIGHELRHDTDGGDLLRTHDIIAPRYVTRGGLVTLKIETPFLLLTAQGKSLQDGAQGDVVRVTNTQSNRMVEGTVEGPGIVRIRTAQRVAEAQ